MDAIEANDYKLQNCGRINILFGKNGCGKSTTLKILTNNLRDKNGLVKYVPPERGGILSYQAHIEQNMGSDPNWDYNERNKNQFGQFREQAVILFKDLRSTISLQLEEYIKARKKEGGENVSIEECERLFFDKYVTAINALLDNIEIRPHKSSFQIYLKGKDEVVPSGNISSGESELVSLAIECLAFDLACQPGKQNILFLDEPDVHIHPDLQAKLMHFLKQLVDSKKFIVVVATHSTAILGALENYEYVYFEFMKKGQKILKFKKVLEEYKSIVPIFGAHPLSNIYCSMPIFLLEGEDDVWIWQKAIRTSGGELKIFPCSVDGLAEMLRYEQAVSEIIGSVYDTDTVMAYSLRDRDKTPDGNNLDDFGKYDKLKRFMLDCRCAENLFLTDQVLAKLGMDWSKMVNEIDTWIQNNTTHQAHTYMKKFQQNGYDRKRFEDIKEIINILVGLITKKPWQVTVGQEVGELVKSTNEPDLTVVHSLANYLGKSLTDWLRSFKK